MYIAYRNSNITLLIPPTRKILGMLVLEFVFGIDVCPVRQLKISKYYADYTNISLVADR